MSELQLAKPAYRQAAEPALVQAAARGGHLGGQQVDKLSAC